jgi:hypothetical protein
VKEKHKVYQENSLCTCAFWWLEAGSEGMILATRTTHVKFPKAERGLVHPRSQKWMGQKEAG